MTDTKNMNPREVLDACIDAARLADPLVAHPDGRRHLLVPQGFKIENVSDPYALPPRISAGIQVDDRASLVGYANRFSDKRSIIFGDYDEGTITARLDWHMDNAGDEDRLKAQHACHAVHLRLRDSLEYERWNGMEGEMHAQEDFARFIEENVADLAYPDHSTMLEICRDLEASQGSAFKSGVRLDNGDRTFRYETETRVTSDITVPTEITLSIPLYFGEEPTDVTAKFRYRATPQGLRLGFAWHRVEYLRQATFRSMAYIAAEETGLPIYFGRSV